MAFIWLAALIAQEAADLLNISLPSLLRLVQDGDIPCQGEGAARRIPLSGLLDHKRKNDAARLAALDELAALDQELGFGN